MTAVWWSLKPGRVSKVHLILLNSTTEASKWWVRRMYCGIEKKLSDLIVISKRDLRGEPQEHLCKRCQAIREGS